MQIETDHREHDQTGQPLWAAPAFVVRAIIEALLHFLGLYSRMKSYNRNTRFRSTWRDSFAGLRLLEWNRARMRAIFAEAMLRGENPDNLPPFEMDDNIPEGFGGPCPSTPLEMNRRFLSLARFRLDPHADIARYLRRIAKRAGIELSVCSLRLVASRPATSPALRAEKESTCARGQRRSLSSSDAQHRERWQARACAADGGGSRRLIAPAPARAPPKLSPVPPYVVPIPSAPRR